MRAPALPDLAVLPSGQVLVLGPDGRVHQLSPATVAHCRGLAAHGGNTAAAAAEIAARCAVDPHRVDQDLQALTATLRDKGLTPATLLAGVDAQPDTPPPPGPLDTPMATPSRARPPIVTTAAGFAAAAAARLALLAAPWPRLLAGLRCLAATTRRPATRDQVAATLAAIDHAATWLPCRVACLERSIAALLLLAARRRGVTLRIGARTDPVSLHAWLDAAGPVAEPPTTATYQPLTTISPRSSQ